MNRSGKKIYMKIKRWNKESHIIRDHREGEENKLLKVNKYQIFSLCALWLFFTLPYFSEGGTNEKTVFYILPHYYPACAVIIE